MPPSGVDYASEFLNGYAPEYVSITLILHYTARLFSFSEKEYPKSDNIVIPFTHGF